MLLKGMGERFLLSEDEPQTPDIVRRKQMAMVWPFVAAIIRDYTII